MRIMTCRWYAILLLCLYIFSAPHVHGGTVIESARAAGMGVAFTATADDPSAIVFNPAGLAGQRGTHYYGGTAAFYMRTEYDSPQGDTEKTKSAVYFPPHAYLISDFGMETMGFGLGIYSPLGIGGRKWSDTGPIRYLSTENTIATMEISAAFGWAFIPDRLSIGGGLLYMYSQNTMERMLDQSALGAGDGKISYDGWGTGAGFTLSLLASPFDRFRIGLHYRSRVEITHDGELELEDIAPALRPLFGGDRYKTDAENEQDMPSLVAIGLACDFTDDLTVGMDFQWAEWSVFDTSTLKIDHPVPQAGLMDLTTAMNWEDTWVVSLGAEYRLDEHWTIRGGYFYTENAVPDESVNPATPEADSHTLTLGTGWHSGKITLDAAYVVQLPAERDVENSILSGEYTNTIHTLTLSLGYAF